MVRSPPVFIAQPGVGCKSGGTGQRSRPLPTGSDLRACLFYIQYKGVLGDRELDIFLSQPENYMSVFLSNEHRM